MRNRNSQLTNDKDSIFEYKQKTSMAYSARALIRDSDSEAVLPSTLRKNSGHSGYQLTKDKICQMK